MNDFHCCVQKVVKMKNVEINVKPWQVITISLFSKAETEKCLSKTSLYLSVVVNAILEVCTFMLRYYAIIYIFSM